MKKPLWITLGILAVLLFAGYRLFAGNYNRFVALDEGLKAAWAQVENQYQRRYDLIPNLVETVKGYATHEKETLEKVTESRAKMGGMVNIGADAVRDPAALQRFQAAQSELSSALQRLMVVSENYPDLKANANFRDLQAQLEGTENRISTERRRYNETVMAFNTTLRRFPGNLVASMYGFKVAAPFAAEAQAQQTPKVSFQ